MRIARLYVHLPLTAGQTVDLDQDCAHYLRTVLRLSTGAALVLFNGNGCDYDAVVTDTGRSRVAVCVKAKRQRSVESPLAVTLGLSISRAERMDWALQKAVELGVSHITPLLAERCVVQLKGDKIAQKTAHWRKILHHAAEQCGRTVLPILSPPQQPADWASQQQGLKIFLDPYAATGLRQLHPEAGLVALLSGPEGGFTDWERQTAQIAGFIPVRLGPRILRTESAALAALAAVQTLWGDLA
ncbi:MAG: 16S rRNA (uracil(1498)-N(3))-methyltransferase [Gammaproteobacteria bacterium]